MFTDDDDSQRSNNHHDKMILSVISIISPHPQEQMITWSYS